MKSLLALLMAVIAPFSASATGQSVANAHQFSFVSIDGEEVALADLKGRPVMVVNTASHCGLTPQYTELQQLYEKYKSRGFEIIAVPSPDFGGQEFGSEGEVKEFVEAEFSPTFPVMSIAHVKGDNAHPFYQWANDQVSFVGAPKWNFHKYLIGPDGALVEWFASTTSPMSPKIQKAIEGLLEANVE